MNRRQFHLRNGCSYGDDGSPGIVRVAGPSFA